jgi:GDP-mannose 6-dehydrogenase
MVVNMDAVLEHGDTIVIGNNATEFKDVFGKLREDQTVVDLVRITDDFNTGCGYEGICW